MGWDCKCNVVLCSTISTSYKHKSVKNQKIRNRGQKVYEKSLPLFSGQAKVKKMSYLVLPHPIYEYIDKDKNSRPKFGMSGRKVREIMKAANSVIINNNFALPFQSRQHYPCQCYRKLW